MGNLFSISIPIGDVVSPCWNCTARQAMHGCDLGEGIQSLTNNWDELRRMMNDVKGRIDNGEQEGSHMKRLDQVQGWILRVERLDQEVEELIMRSTQETEMTCCRGCCPKNCKRRYKLGKKAAQKLQEVADLKSKGNFNSVVDKVPLIPVAARQRYSEPTVGLESLIDEVWRYITHDDRVGIIGLYGMGGVGKTTLLTEINNNLSKATHDFKIVIWVLVSKEPNIGKLQEEIGKKIGYRDTMWTNKSQYEKAEDISSVLREKKFVLLLDDIWKRFDLKEVGVPFPNEENKSKVVFTTRSDDVCGRMGAKRVIVKCLAPDEAWDLFKKKVGEYAINSHPEILNLAKLVVQECAGLPKLVVQECAGLPLALITIGRAMACKKTPQEWSHALTLLRNNAALFTGMEDEVFRLLKFSYDSLPSEAHRYCFLYCSLFPEDLYIPKTKLINYWLSEGFLDEYFWHDMKLYGYNIIGTLIHACLLEADENGGVKMHDVIRDMALWIGKDKFLVQTHAGLTEAHELEWRGLERISLMSSHIKELAEAASCHNLLTLFLNDNRLKIIVQGFFRSMRGLRVLDLSRNEEIVELPEEISLLVSLRYLNLSGTSITKLPVELKNLGRLKYLDLTYTNDLHEIPKGLISSFKKLQVLKMFGCGSSTLFKEESPFWGCQKSLVKELMDLRHLNDLSITIRSSAVLESLSLGVLKIRRLGWSHLKVKHYAVFEFNDWMKILERLEIVDCEYESYTIYSNMINKSQFHSLRSVFIVRCSKLQDLTLIGFAQNLELLVIAYCKDITEIIHDHYDGAFFPFSRLRELYLIELPQLRSVYSKALPFPCLKFIGVEGCPMLRDLPLDSESAKGCGLTIQGYEDWWNGLRSKGAASFCLIDAKEKTMKKPESSTSTSTSTSKADAFLPYFKSFD